MAVRWLSQWETGRCELAPEKAWVATSSAAAVCMVGADFLTLQVSHVFGVNVSLGSPLSEAHC